MQSVRARIVCAAMRSVFCSPLMFGKSLSDAAGKKTKNIKSHYKPSRGFCVSRHFCGEAFYEKLVCEKGETDKVVFHLHGGGFRVKLIDTYRKLAEKYSRLLGGATVITVDYRVFPEYEFPSQLEDSLAAYKEIIGQGVKPENIIFIGDSAGATLALATALYLRDNGLPLPGAIVCFSLWGDATSSGESKEKNAHRDPIYGLPKRERVEDNLDYLHGISRYAKKLDRTNPYVSPCFGSFEGFPPVTLVCGEAEVDASDSDRVYEKLVSAGADAALHKSYGMFHCFQLIPFLPESRRAYEFVRERLMRL